MTDQPWYHLTIDDALNRLGSNLEGLSADQVEPARRQFGTNLLPPARGRSRWSVLFDQFRSSLIYILIIAAGISFAVGETRDGLVISGVVLMNAIIGFYQETRASSALQRLLRASPQFTHVIRDRQERELPLDQLVVGDVVLVSSGDQVAADGRWVAVFNLKINEATMTGEAVPVEKISPPLPAAVSVQEQRNMGWRGTTVVAGRGKLLVTAVGGQTRFGELLAKLQTIDHSRTPWQEKLQQFARRLAAVTVMIGFIVVALGWLRELPADEVFLLAVSLIVSIIPEGLPLVMTMAMTSGIAAMAKRQAIVRKPVAVETLGAVTVVAADKTGTLTFGEMMVQQAWTDGQTFRLTGEGYSQSGDIFLGSEKVIGQEHPGLQFLFKLAALNNDARFSLDQEGRQLPIGDPTELALLVAAGKSGWSKIDLDTAHPRQGEVPFDHQRKYMVTWHADERQTLLTVKGAPHEVLALCQQRWRSGESVPLSEADRRTINGLYERWAGEGLRGLAVAYARRPEPPTALSHDSLVGQLTLVGVVAMADSIRPEAPAALRTMAEAGIQTIMLTGDYQQTGLAIAIKLGLLRRAEPATMLDGREVDGLSDDELAARLRRVIVGTRLTPDHKLRIATILKKRGQIVAMTGDGINDVPALLAADVGVAIGRQSSDAAKEAADIVLVDGNFLHLIAAIAEGRRTLRNIRRVMVYLVASNFGELVLIVAALLLGWPLPLLPKHIIWLNAVTDPFLGIALAGEPASPSVMRERPQDRQAPLISRSNWERIIVGAVTIGLSSLMVFLLISRAGGSANHIFAVTLTTIALSEWLMAVTLRSARRSVVSGVGRNAAMLVALTIVLLMQSAILYIPALAAVFGLSPLSLTDWVIVLLGAAPIVLVEEIRKLWIRRRDGKGVRP